MKSKNLIVGLDPGTTVGIAILSLEGNVLSVFSKKNFSKSEVINFISKYGRPLLIASDKPYTPKFISQISAQFGCKSYHQKRELKVSEKNQLVAHFSSIIKNDHERDALAAAIKAWKETNKRIKSTLEFLKKVGIDEKEIDDNLFFFFVKNKLKTEKKHEEKKKSKKINSSRNCYEKIKLLQEEINLLSKALASSKKEIEFYKNILLNLKKVDKESEKKELIAANETLKKMNRILRNGLIPLIEIDRLTLDNLEKFDRLFGLEGQVVITKDKERLNNLVTCSPLCVILEEEEIPNNLKFPVFSVKAFEIKKIDGIKAISKSKLGSKLREVKKWELKKMLKEYREKRH